MSTRAAGPAAVRYDHVLVPLDGSPFADAALGTARALAARFGAELHAVVAADRGEEADRLRTHALGALGDGAEGRIHVVLDGEPVQAIETKAAELGSCLVCMSTHGRGRITGAVIGSVARAILQRSDEPIVAVGPIADRPGLFGSASPEALSVPRLVACVDGSPASASLVPVAAGWASELGMSLTILTVAEPVPPPLRAGASWRRGFGPDGDPEAYVAGLADEWRGVVPDVSTHVQWDAISPAEGVGTYLDDHPAGLVAVTTHARSGWERLFIGAAAAGIVRASIAPALVVPLPDEPVVGNGVLP
jgi:nucleotide-binding universal stress UspA family protein